MKKKSGFTLVEIGIFLLIAAAIVFAVIRLTSGKKASANANRDAAIIFEYIQQFQKASQFGAVLNSKQQIIDNKVLPKDWTINGSNVVDHYGGTMEFFFVRPSTAEFAIYNVAKETCQELIPLLAQNKNILGIGINLTWLRNPGVQSDINFATKSSLCDANTPGRIVVEHRRLAF